MKHRAITLIIWGLMAVPASAQTTLFLDADRPGGAVRPGEQINWSIGIRVGDSNNRGLAAISVDLVTDLPALAPSFELAPAFNASPFPDRTRQLDLPAKLRDLCDEVPESEFRQDISSTELRRCD